MRVFIFAHLHDEMGGRCPRHVHQYRACASNLRGLLVEVRPIERHPVIASIAAKDRARLKTNHCFTAIPDPSGVVTVTGGDVRIGAVTGDAARAPYTTAVDAVEGAGGPCCYTGRIIYGHSHQPPIKKVAIPVAPISNVKNVAHNGERRALALDLWSESPTIVLSRQLHVHRPAGIDGAGVHVKGNDVMFLGYAAIG